MLRRVRQTTGVLMVLGCSLIISSSVFATQSPQSANYRFDESSIGTGGLNQSSSTNFQSDGSIGDLSIGRSSSANFQTEAGSRTTNDPTLSFRFNSSNVNFPNFSAATGSVATASFSVLNYTSYGYVVQVIGAAPQSGGHTIAAMGANAVSQPGIEQFGLNLVANTSPSSVGANLDNGQFGFGQVAANYGTPNQYRYVSGETVALAPKSSGETTYTMTYLVNVASLTPGGKYTSNQTIIVTGTY